MTSPGGYRERRGWGRAWAEPLSCACLPPVSLLHSRETYNSLAAWLTDARTLASPNIVVILCGNKKDLDPEREVTFLEASRFAQENGEGPVVGQWRRAEGAQQRSRGSPCRPAGLPAAMPSKRMWRFRGLGSNSSVATCELCHHSGPVSSSDKWESRPFCLNIVRDGWLKGFGPWRAHRTARMWQRPLEEHWLLRRFWPVQGIGIMWGLQTSMARGARPVL